MVNFLLVEIDNDLKYGCSSRRGRSSVYLFTGKNEFDTN